jgi:hypothetical protein
MAPTESFFGPKSLTGGAGPRRLLVWSFVVVTVNPTLSYGQDNSLAPEPTVGSAVATDRVQAPEQEPQTPEPTLPDPGAPAPGSVTAVGSNTATSAAVDVPTGNSAMGALRAVARQLVPAEDLRLRKLDTSFPAEQPEFDVVEPERDVVADQSDVSPRGASRRTVVRVVDGVTVLTNVTDQPGAGEQGYVDSTTRRPATEGRADMPQTQAALVALRSDVVVNSNALSPETKAGSSDGLGVWLWVLSGFAALLLVPIAVLLTRPVRKG